ncbi:hypothetical protein [Paracoccus sp. pheM1]|uniref:hypothetical protein n=1 Tax=Paracoccus sp. pheM1 TaxID=2831675 RepID=UPI001BDB8785|nr:hypothetical protein [Paracoccus sp. pheM1]MBT0781275.1 hypothetical protein [Paracoccus sp. pheM1]
MSTPLPRQPERLSHAGPRHAAAAHRAAGPSLAGALVCEPGQIVIAHGPQQGLDLCARLILDPGDAFAIESPWHATARQVLSDTGAMPISTPVDEAGPRTEALRFAMSNKTDKGRTSNCQGYFAPQLFPPQGP